MILYIKLLLTMLIRPNIVKKLLKKPESVLQYRDKEPVSLKGMGAQIGNTEMRGKYV